MGHHQGRAPPRQASCAQRAEYPDSNSLEPWRSGPFPGSQCAEDLRSAWSSTGWGWGFLGGRASWDKVIWVCSWGWRHLAPDPFFFLCFLVQEVSSFAPTHKQSYRCISLASLPHGPQSKCSVATHGSGTALGSPEKERKLLAHLRTAQSSRGCWSKTKAKR